MIRCRVRLDSRGCLEDFKASGHALSGPGGPRAGSGAGSPGQPALDLACAAVTTLLRTASRMLYRHPGLKVRGGAEQPGEMVLELGPVPAEVTDWLLGATDFLLTGLRDIEKEYPRSLKVVIRRKGTTSHGT